MAKKKNYEELARNIILNVGGKENINSFRQRITRVRFRLRDESIANDDKLNDMDGIISVLNPIQTSSMRKNNIRKTKTDKVDTFVIANPYNYLRLF